MNKLYIVATPIGNLGDITQRALEALQQADFILCEDTRVTRKLLTHFDIHKPTISYHHHSTIEKIGKIKELLLSNNLALVSDAGTPGISDPGNRLIEEVKDMCEIIPIPGPSAIATIISVAGFATDRFLFLGFIPQKKKRSQFIEEINTYKYPVIFYESCHRIIKTLKELDPDLEVVVGRELTKKFETIYRGTTDKVIDMIEKDKIKGEFTIIRK